MTGNGLNTILVVSEVHPDPDLNLGFLRQPDIRLLHCSPDSGVLEMVQAERPDLIIEDRGADRPEADGFCPQLKSDPETRAIPLILVTSPATRSPGGKTAADVLLHKPLVPREFYEVVRRFVALPIRRYPRYKANLRFQFRLDGRLVQAFSRDMSVNGAFLKTDRVVATGSHLQVRFRLPTGGHEVLCGAVVRNSTEFGGSGLAGFGVEFEGIHDDDLQQLEAFLRKHGPSRRSTLFSFL